MKAVIYQQYGPPDVLRVANVDKPTPKPNEILIKIQAVEATKSDCEWRSFNFPVKWFWLPLRITLGLSKPKKQILGGYFSGEIESIGDKVTLFKPADKIFGSAGFKMGAYGEYLCLPESATLVDKPKNMSFEEAAAVPLGGLNALHYMRKAKILAGEKILINGAGGSIGIFAVQIAKTMGADVTVVDSAIKREMLLSIGSDHFIDYDQTDFTKGDTKYDVIFSMVANSNYSGLVNSLKSGGRYLMANPRFSHMLRSVLTTKLTDKIVQFAFAGEKKEELESLKKLIEENKIKSVIDKTYPPEQAADAHRKVETEQRIGIVVISVNP